MSILQYDPRKSKKFESTVLPKETEYIAWSVLKTTALSYPNEIYHSLIEKGFLNHKNKIRTEITDFWKLIVENEDFITEEGNKMPEESLIKQLEDFLYTLCERLIEQNLIIPLLNITYNELYDGSIDLTLDRLNYNLLINLSNSRILYSLIHKTNPKVLEQGVDELNAIYDSKFIDVIITQIKRFEK
jgi:hypothetical protein